MYKKTNSSIEKYMCTIYITTYASHVLFKHSNGELAPQNFKLSRLLAYMYRLSFVAEQACQCFSKLFSGTTF